MSQKERTVQPSDDEQRQNEPYQKTRSLAKEQLNRQVVDKTNASPSLQNAGSDLSAVQSEAEKKLDESGTETVFYDQQMKAVEAGNTPEAQEKVEEALKATTTPQPEPVQEPQPAEGQNEAGMKVSNMATLDEVNQAAETAAKNEAAGVTYNSAAEKKD